ncbi:MULTISPECIES: SDR family NAD(P)-dependent oxidoreductase [Delftia]|uniref:Short-chain dehydrogenase n=2 Tax=Delftia TaxID=80865 RepID=A0ABN4SMU6_9BURK|nr:MULTISPECIES: SDR family oxidoreductase [Delftia]AOV04772.1 short-chain dehydrogenase [Delftia tsuruhatensis]MCO5335048.1 SDR family oxidoreductase [Delftia tsuruhatensis]MCR4542854.1 SDR family oxidoreductase [Delftia tsuruhatensis]MDH2233257.1 SDR family oxidoreductase [Delftia tsuruhatensis]SDY60543.1 NAD(P)-dependent dehydrogenase, short-chain alcohol dehydrogenase family [Delftia lacustris]
MSTVDNKTPVTVVSGASNGIGRAIAEALLAQGRAVVNLDYVLPDWSHPLLVSYQADLTSEQATAEAAARIAAAHNVVALVNNAGATRPGTIDNASTRHLDDVVGLHLRAPMLLVQAFLPTLRACGEGRIVNMSSRAALGKPDRIVYSATKAGLIGLTRTLAMELGRNRITVNALGPGPIATELFTKSNPEGAPQTQRILNSIAVGRMGTPEDVARAALFFLSPDNGFVTGQVLYICGGTTLGVAPV